jgi:Glycosyl transferase family 2
MARQGTTCSIVIEWYNLTYADHSRAARALAALESQASALRAPDAGPVSLDAPLEVIVCFDTSLDQAAVRSALGGFGTRDRAVDARLLPVRDSCYTQLKNAGARVATGEILVFLDSDVIPEDGWLAALLLALQDPAVSAVVGNTYTDYTCGSTYARAMALAWMFPLRDASDALTTTSCFYANNVAFRRDVFLAHPFAETPGLTHRPATLLVDELARAGIPIWHAAAARAAHPPPNGPMHFVRRAMAGGRARVLGAANAADRAVLRGLAADARAMSWSCGRILRERRRVGLRSWQVPAALIIAAGYHTLFAAGALLTAAFPGFMRQRFVL